MLKNSNPLWTIIGREIDWMRTHWEYWFLTLVGPLIGFILIVGIFHRGVVRNLDVTVVDNDNTKMSRQVLRMIDATSIVHLSSNSSSLHEAEQSILEGKTKAIIKIEEGFEKNILKASPDANIVIYIDGENILKGGLLKSGILQAVSTFNVGVQMQIAMKRGDNYSQALNKTVPISLDSHVLFNPYTNYFYFLATILMPVIMIVFTLTGSIYTLGYELRNGTSAAALKKANNSIVVLSVGKLLPYTILFFIQAMIFNYIIFGIMGVPMTGNYAVIVVSELLMILSYQSLAILLIGVFGNLRLSVSLGGAYSMMALTFAGLTFPEFGMPVAAQIFGRIFPLTYWLKVFLGQTLRQDPLTVSMPEMLYLFVFIISGLVCMHWLKQKYSNEKYWNKI